MTNRHFSFSFIVGIAIATLGGVILNEATVGFGLIALGVAIAGLALLTRYAQQQSSQAHATPLTGRHFQSSAADH